MSPLPPSSGLASANDASMILQRSFPGVFPLTNQPLRRTNYLNADTAFVTIHPAPQWTLLCRSQRLPSGLESGRQSRKFSGCGPGDGRILRRGWSTRVGGSPGFAGECATIRDSTGGFASTTVGCRRSRPYGQTAQTAVLYCVLRANMVRWIGARALRRSCYFCQPVLYRVNVAWALVSLARLQMT
jgi:hypothetical protein